VPDYNVTVTIQPKSKTAKPSTLTITRPFSEWFDAVGHFVVPPFQTMLASNVPVIGKLDPKRVATESHNYSADMLDAALAASTGSDAAGGDGKKAGKRRKA
jgi:hypothetical protein